MRRLTCLAVTVAMVLALTAGTAAASHDTQFTFSNSPTTADTPAGIYLSAVFGDDVPSSVVAHFAAGHQFNEEGAADAPLEGEKVGEGTVHARFWVVLCALTTMNYSIYWDDLDNTTEEPAGSVARFKIVPTLGSTFYTYLVQRTGSDTYQSGAHYDMVIPTWPTAPICTSNADMTTTMTLYAYSRDSSGQTTTHWVTKNPVNPGTYTTWLEWYDTGSGNHSDSAQYTVTS